QTWRVTRSPGRTRRTPPDARAARAAAPPRGRARGRGPAAGPPPGPLRAGRRDRAARCPQARGSARGGVGPCRAVLNRTTMLDYRGGMSAPRAVPDPDPGGTLQLRPHGAAVLCGLVGVLCLGLALDAVLRAGWEGVLVLPVVLLALALVWMVLWAPRVVLHGEIGRAA